MGAGSALRSMMAIFAPSAANSLEAAPPIPVAPPEMMAVLCARRPNILILRILKRTRKIPKCLDGLA
jgi:hypothetical protein